MTLDTNILSKNNLFRVLADRHRYNNNNGVIKYGFLGVFCVKSDFLKKRIKRDVDELKNEFNYDRIFILNRATKFDFACIQENSLLVVECDDYKKSSQLLSPPMALPPDLIGICTVPCSRKISVVLIMSESHPKIWQNADFIYKEENIDLPEWTKEAHLPIKLLI